jgi:hypothetical protein
MATGETAGRWSSSATTMRVGRASSDVMVSPEASPKGLAEA